MPTVIFLVSPPAVPLPSVMSYQLFEDHCRAGVPVIYPGMASHHADGPCEGLTHCKGSGVMLGILIT